MDETVTFSVTLVYCLATRTASEGLLPQRPGEMQTSFCDNDLLELLENEFPWIPEKRTHGGGAYYMFSLTDITRSRTLAEM
jgi:hypothetical protein